MYHLWQLWLAYGWSSLKGNGPEDLTSTTVKFAIAAAVYPPLHRWVTREERAMRSLMHAKMNHIIENHPDIPDFPPSPSAK